MRTCRDELPDNPRYWPEMQAARSAYAQIPFIALGLSGCCYLQFPKKYKLALRLKTAKFLTYTGGPPISIRYRFT